MGQGRRDGRGGTLEQRQKRVDLLMLGKVRVGDGFKGWLGTGAGGRERWAGEIPEAGNDEPRQKPVSMLRCAKGRTWGAGVGGEQTVEKDAWGNGGGEGKPRMECEGDRKEWAKGLLLGML